MKLTVEAVSESKKGFKANGNWYNRAKNANFTDFSSLKKGVTVETDPSDNKWISSFTVVDGGGDGGQQSSESKSASSRPMNSEIQLQIVRQSSLATAFNFYTQQQMDHSESISLAKTLAESLVRYVTTGKFEE